MRSLLCTKSNQISSLYIYCCAYLLSNVRIHYLTRCLLLSVCVSVLYIDNKYTIAFDCKMNGVQCSLNDVGYSNMTSSFRFVDKRAIYRWYNLRQLFVFSCVVLPSIKMTTLNIFKRRVWRYQREVIRIRISKKNRQHNGQKKKYKRTNNDHQSIHIKLKIE